jgi:cytochrome P450
MTTTIENLTKESVLYGMGVTCQPDFERMFSLFRSAWEGQTLDDSEACRERFRAYFEKAMAEARSQTKPLISDLLEAAQEASAI